MCAFIIVLKMILIFSLQATICPVLLPYSISLQEGPQQCTVQSTWFAHAL